MLRSSVVFPQPLGPSRPTTWPHGTSTVRPGITTSASTYHPKPGDRTADSGMSDPMPAALGAPQGLNLRHGGPPGRVRRTEEVCFLPNG